MSSNIIKKIIKNFKNKKKYKNFIKNNTLDFQEKKVLDSISLQLEGNNNLIKIGKNTNIEKLFVKGYSNNSKIIIGDNFSCGTLTVQLGQNHENFGQVNNTSVIIGNNISVGYNNQIITFNSNSTIEIDNNCMLASNITIYNTDAHPIFKKGTKEIINKVKGIKIGEHSWIGMGVTILKNSIVPPNSIIGCNAVFSGGRSETRSYCAFAGNPAKVVKENVDWAANGSKYGYIENI